MIHLELFWSFFQIGLFTIGGGYAAMPIIQHQVVDLHGWLNLTEFADIISISQMTPGPIAVNSATFVGYRVAGFLGALFATIGVVLPSFLVILLLAGVLEQFKELKYVSYAFEGVRAGVAVLIINAVFKLSKQCPKNVFAIVVAAAAFILVALFSLNVIVVIICAAVAGIAFQLWQKRKGGEAP